MPGCISSIECLSANAGRRQTKTLAEVVLRSRLAERKEGAAVSDKEATTMTVRAMGALLGLKKNGKLLPGQQKGLRYGYGRWPEACSEGQL